MNPYQGCNLTIPSYQCTLQTCCLAQSSFDYRPNLGANLFFAIFFAVFIVPQVVFGVLYRTYGYAIALFLGLALEVVGYAARVSLHENPFSSNGFLIYLITITIAPVFLSAGIYLCLTRIIVIYGENNSRLKPRTIAIGFMTSDFLSLVLQAAGGAIADTATAGSSSQQVGVDIMIAGLFLQAVSLAVFLVVGALFAWSCHRGVLNQDPERRRVRGRFFFQAFLGGLLLSTITILIRSIFRVIELWGGFNGKLWNDETDFLVLDGAMIAIAVICLMVFHPGPALDGQWAAANWSFKTKVSRDKLSLDLPLNDSS